MVNIYPIISQFFDSNSYVIEDEKIAIIDTGFTKIMENEIYKILNKIRNLETNEIYIINTHCHYDHIGNNEKILQLSNKVKIFVSKYDKEAIIQKDDKRILSYLFNDKVPEIKEEYIEPVYDNSIINLGETKLNVISTPGHTLGSISIYEQKSKSLFVGDLIFARGIGRSDLIDSDFELQRKSIEKILSIDFKNLYSGHGMIGNYEDAKSTYEEYFT